MLAAHHPLAAALRRLRPASLPAAAAVRIAPSPRALYSGRQGAAIGVFGVTPLWRRPAPVSSGPGDAAAPAVDWNPAARRDTATDASGRMLTAREVKERQAAAARAGAARMGEFLLPDDFELPQEAVEAKHVRGAGPGGQGVNSSSNKVELRVDIDALVANHGLNVRIADTLRLKGRVSQSGHLIATCHDHRSATDNRAACERRVLHQLRQASYVPPPFAPSMPLEAKKTEKRVHRHRAAADKRKLRAGARKLKVSACR